MKTLIKGTFLDEISHDIPHQNWGEAEWDKDFAAMKAMGIECVILIRCGYQRWLTYPSAALMKYENGYKPSADLVELFLRLAEKYSMDFFFGLYDSGKYWVNGNYQAEVDINKRVIDEVWAQYGSSPAFKGWYITQELSRKDIGVINTYIELGKHCKSVSSNLTTLISPYVDGRKQVSQYSSLTQRAESVSLQTHEAEWNEIFDAIQKSVDVVAFQDGQVEYDELPDFLSVNKKLTDRYGLKCWTNTESFDRDMPIKFLPTKWDKLQLKLEAAAQAGIHHAITFEFSHFMSPNSAYKQAGHLYNRYQEYRFKM
jgi:hypothetical protein